MAKSKNFFDVLWDMEEPEVLSMKRKKGDSPIFVIIEGKKRKRRKR